MQAGTYPSSSTISKLTLAILGGLLIVVGMMMLGGLDRMADAARIQAMPAWLVDLSVRF